MKASSTCFDFKIETNFEIQYNKSHSDNRRTHLLNLAALCISLRPLQFFNLQDFFTQPTKYTFYVTVELLFLDFTTPSLYSYIINLQINPTNQNC